MKVLVIHTFYKLQGGEDHVVANEMQLLESAGNEVELLSFSNENNTLLKLLQIGFNFSSYQQTLDKLSSFKPDVVHIHNLHFGGSAAVLYAIKKAKVPVVMTLHNYRLLCPSGSLFTENKLFLNSVYKSFPWKAVKKGVYQESSLITFWVALSGYLHQKAGTWRIADQLIVLGEHSKSLFSNSKLSELSRALVVKPNFCYSPLLADVVRANKYFLYVGRLTEEKGLKVLLEAFAGSGLPLKIVESYTLRHTNITFLGQQSKEKVSFLLSQAAALIFPSLWYETFGMVVIEAFAMSVPVIASDLGNMKIMVTHELNGLTFEAGNPQELLKTLKYYWELDPEVKKRYQMNARAAYLERYTPDNNLLQLENIYQEAIRKHQEEEIEPQQA
jgi:glycosyltransferase involved in cell wall biosynthesis